MKDTANFYTTRDEKIIRENAEEENSLNKMVPWLFKWFSCSRAGHLSEFLRLLMMALVNLLPESNSQLISSSVSGVKSHQSKLTRRAGDIETFLSQLQHVGHHDGQSSQWEVSWNVRLDLTQPVDDVKECDLWTNLFSRSHNNKLRYLASALHYYIYFWQSNTFSPVLSKNNCRKVFSLHWYSVEELADLGEAALRRNCSTSTHFLTC